MSALHLLLAAVATEAHRSSDHHHSSSSAWGSGVALFIAAAIVLCCICGALGMLINPVPTRDAAPEADEAPPVRETTLEANAMTEVTKAPAAAAAAPPRAKPPKPMPMEKRVDVYNSMLKASNAAAALTSRPPR